MKLTGKEGFTFMEGGVCAAKGFEANGLNCGLNPNKEKNDLGLVFCSVPCNTGAVYTQNKVKGAPILVTKKNLEASGGISRAIIVNSKNANTCNADGEQKAERMSQLAAEALGIAKEEVIVASTGVIGQVLPIGPIEAHMEQLAEGLTVDGNERAANAIMTTDTVKKEVAVEFVLGGVTCRLGGMAKGSGMIHPNMATTLNFVTTDVAISSALVQKALDEVVKVTYNCLSVDGDTSTNDTLTVMANGLAGNACIKEENADYEIFKEALYIVLMNLTKMLAADGEGATKLITCVCDGAPDLDTGIVIAKSVICSPLVKCAMYGADANCGRIMCAMGYAKTDCCVTKADVYYISAAGKILVCQDGNGLAFDEDLAKEILMEDEIEIYVDLHQGDAKATAWGCDLTYDYVKINGDYRS